MISEQVEYQHYSECQLLLRDCPRCLRVWGAPLAAARLEAFLQQVAGENYRAVASR